VAGRAGGIPLQMADGTGGVLVDSVEECAQALVSLLSDPPRARRLGAAGRERVRRHFLIPRMLLDELSLMRRLAIGATGGLALERVSHRDPVCGMAVEAAQQTATVDGLTLPFCSEQCKSTFTAAPGRYLPSLPQPPALEQHAGL
jgi:trehalose synthase